MATVFTQVDRDPVRSSLLGQQCRLDRIWNMDPSRLTDRGDMIYIDT
jgi:hypothetical protein